MPYVARLWKPKAGSSFSDVKGLIHHENQFSEEHKEAFRDAFERMQEIVGAFSPHIYHLLLKFACLHVHSPLFCCRS
jgi:hypothetical protein